MFRRLIAAAAAFVCIGAPLAHAQSFNAQEQAEIRAIVRDYLVRNPDVLQEAIDALQEQRQREVRARMENEPRAFSLGPRNAPITIVEFFDYRCPYCHAAAEWVFATARARSDVRVVFMEQPSLGPESLEASRAAIASMKQGRYEAFHRALMAHNGALDTARIDTIARSVGIDVARMRRDMRDPAVDQLIDDVHEMSAQAGGQGTPFFVINGRTVYGFARDQLEAAITEAAREARAAARVR